jgi:hypothetical protein
MAIRSARLLTFYSTSGPAQSPAYSTRAGFTTIVKSVHVANSAGTPADVSVIANTSASVAVPVLSATLAATTITDWNGWLILAAGDFIYCNVSAANVGIWISGTILEGVQQFPPATFDVAGLPAAAPQSPGGLVALGDLVGPFLH